MKRPGCWLLGLGVLATIGAVVTGGADAGYGLGPGAFVLRAGVALTMLGAATWTLDRPSVGAVAGVVLGTVLAVYAVGVGAMWLDLGVNPPEYGTPLTIDALLGYQAVYALYLLPVPFGYAAGIGMRRGREYAGLLVPASTFLAFVTAIAVSTALTPDQHMMALLFDAVSVLASTLLALVPFAAVTTVDEHPGTERAGPEST